MRELVESKEQMSDFSMTSVYEFQAGAIDFSRNVIRLRGEDTPVEPKIMQVLQVLVQNSGQVVTRNELLDRVWKTEVGGDESLSRAISVLRRGFADHSPYQFIETVPKKGYRFVAELTPVAGGKLQTPKLSSGDYEKTSFGHISLRRLAMTFILIVSIAGVSAYLTINPWPGTSADAIIEPGSQIDPRVVSSAVDVLLENNRRADLAIEAMMSTNSIIDAIDQLERSYSQNVARYSVDETMNVLHQIGAMSIYHDEDLALTTYKQIIAFNDQDWLAALQLARLHFLRDEKAEANLQISNAMAVETVNAKSRLVMDILHTRINSQPFHEASEKLYEIAESAINSGYDDVGATAMRFAVNYEWLAIATNRKTLNDVDFSPVRSKLSILEAASKTHLDHGQEHEAALDHLVLGVLYRVFDEFDEALKHNYRALELEQLFYRPSRRHAILSNIANLNYLTGKYSDAKAYNARAMDELRRAGTIADMSFNWMLSARIAKAAGEEEIVCLQIERAIQSADTDVLKLDVLDEIKADLSC